MDTSGIDQLLQEAVRAGALPGVVAVAGDLEGQLYEGAFGRLSIERQEPVRADTMFFLASMTKAITSLAALQLIERGTLELEQPVVDVVPAFGELEVLEGFDGDEPLLRKPTRAATVRQLLTHTSGLGYWFSNPTLMRYHELTGIPDPLSGRRTIFALPLVDDPGARWEYGTSVDWLGRVIEAVAGEDLAGYCAEHLFDPLGMTDTTFYPSEAQRARLMKLHARAPDGGLVLSPIELPAEPAEFASGGGGALGTAGDYLRFMRALLRGGELDGERILRPETVELAFGNHLGEIELPALMSSAVPELTNDVPAMPFAQGFGLGFHLILEDLPGTRRAGTGDWAGLLNCFYWIDRASGVAGALLTQVLPFFDVRVVEQSVAFEAALYAAVGAPASA